MHYSTKLIVAIGHLLLYGRCRAWQSCRRTHSATISSAIFVSSSVRMEQLVSHWTHFLEI